MGEAHITTGSAHLPRPSTVAPDRELAVRVGAWVALGFAYFGAAKLGQTLRYTASVSAIWPPVGLGIAALYLWGLPLWPGIFVGELLVNGQLLFENTPLPFGSVVGQQLGNMAEVIVGAWLLLRLIGPRAKLDRAVEIGKLIIAVGTATAISASVGTLSMLAGDVIESGAAPNFWRTCWLGDSSGALVVLPLMLVWVANPKAAWRRIACTQGVAMIATVVALATFSVTNDAPLTYLIFPALIWAAFRFGAPGVTLATTINAGITIGVTADRLGPFFKQPIDDRTLSTQLYVLITAITALFLSAVVSERQRSVTELVAARRRENERALAERRRIARELHDSVSQSLFSSGLHTRTAQRALDHTVDNATVRQHLDAIDEQTVLVPIITLRAVLPGDAEVISLAGLEDEAEAGSGSACCVAGVGLRPRRRCRGSGAAITATEFDAEPALCHRARGARERRQAFRRQQRARPHRRGCARRDAGDP